MGDYSYHYNFFHNVEKTLPDYMKKNLEEMQSNKGYIWRGCWFFGKIPCNEQMTVMFERKKGNILYIHEITKKYYKIYEKVGKEYKKLISTKKRRILQLTD